MGSSVTARWRIKTNADGGPRVFVGMVPSARAGATVCADAVSATPNPPGSTTTDATASATTSSVSAPLTNCVEVKTQTQHRTDLNKTGFGLVLREF